MISDANILPFLPSFQKIAPFLYCFVATNQEISDKTGYDPQNLSCLTSDWCALWFPRRNLMSTRARIMIAKAENIPPMSPMSLLCYGWDGRRGWGLFPLRQPYI